MAIVGEVKAILTADSRGLEQAVEKSNRALGTVGTTATASANRTGSAFVSMASGVGKAAVALLGLRSAVQLAGAGLSSLLTGPIRQLGDIADLADAVGSTAEEFTRLRFAVSQGGINDGQLRQQLVNLTRQLEEARVAGSDAAKTFASLGVDTTKGAVTAYEQLIVALSKVEDKQKAVAVASELLGARAGSKILAVGEDLNRLLDVADKTGQTISNSLVKAGDKASDSLDKLAGTIEGFKARAVEPLIPAIERAGDRLTNFFSQDPRGLEIAQDVTAKLGQALDSVTSPDTLSRLGKLGEDLASIAGSLAAIGTGALSALPGIDTLAGSLEKVAKVFNSFPPELQGAIAGALIGARKGPTGAVVGAFGGALTAASPGMADEAKQAAAALGDAAEGVKLLGQIEANRRSEFRTEGGSIVRYKETDQQVIERLGLQPQIDALRDRSRQRSGYLPEGVLAGPEAPMGPFAPEGGLPTTPTGPGPKVKTKAELAADKTAADEAKKQHEQTLKDNQQLLDAIEAARKKALEDTNEAERILANTDVARAAANVAGLSAELARAQREGATLAEQTAIAQKLDQAELIQLAEKRKAVEVEIAQLRNLPEQTETTRATVVALTQQVEELNAEIARGPDNVRNLEQSFIDLGDTIKDAFSALVQGLATNPSTAFKDAGKRFGQAFIGSLTSSIIEDKTRNLDLKIKKNFLNDLPGFAKDGGDSTGKSFTDGLNGSGVVDAAGSIGRDAANRYVQSNVTTVSVAAGRTTVANEFDQRFSAPTADAAQAAATSSQIGGSTGAASSTTGAAGFAGGAAAAGYAAIAIAAIGGITTGLKNASEEAKKFNVTNQDVRGALLGGVVSGSLSALGLGALGDPLGRAVTRLYKNKGAGGLAVRGSFLSPALAGGVPFDPFATFFGDKVFDALGIFRAPKFEDQAGRQFSKVFNKAGIVITPAVRGQDFRNTIYGRDLGDLQELQRLGRAPNEVNVALAGRSDAEFARSPLQTVGRLLFGDVKGADKLFANTFVANARALNLTVSETRDQIKALAAETDLTLVSGIKRLNEELQTGKITLETYNQGVSDLADLLSGTTVGGAKEAVKALQEVSAVGRVSAEELQNALADATQFGASLESSLLEVFLGGGSKRDAFAAAGAEVGKAFRGSFLKELLLSDAATAFFTKARTDIGLAAKAYAEGDVAKGDALLRQGIAEAKSGVVGFQQFARNVSPVSDIIDRSFGMNSSGSFIDQTGRISGAPMFAGPPDVSSYVSAPRSGGAISVTVPVSMDGRVVARAEARNVNLQRTGYTTPNPQLGVG